jgi:hypothetical protein
MSTIRRKVVAVVPWIVVAVGLILTGCSSDSRDSSGFNNGPQNTTNYGSEEWEPEDEPAPAQTCANWTRSRRGCW